MPTALPPDSTVFAQYQAATDRADELTNDTQQVYVVVEIFPPSETRNAVPDIEDEERGTLVLLPEATWLTHAGAYVDAEVQYETTVFTGEG